MGQMAVQGLISGLKSMAPTLQSVTGWLGNLVTGAFTSLLGIHSPSTVFHAHGQMIAQGLINGMESMHGQLAAAGARMGRTVLPGGYGGGAPGGYAAAAPGGGSGAPGGRMEVTLRFEGGEGPITTAIAQGLRGWVRVNGGGGPNSAQRAWGL